MKPTLTIQPNKSGGYTVELDLDRETVEVITRLCAFAVDALRAVNQSASKTETASTRHQVDIQATRDLARERRRANRTLWRRLRNLRRAEPVDDAAISAAITEHLHDTGASKADALRTLDVLERNFRRKLRYRRNRQMALLRSWDLTTAEIARKLSARKIYGAISQSTVSRCLQKSGSGSEARAWRRT